MSHPLGAMSAHTPSLSRWHQAQQAMHAAHTDLRNHRWQLAAAALHVAAHAADSLARYADTADPERAAHWRTVAAARRQLRAKRTTTSADVALAS